MIERKTHMVMFLVVIVVMLSLYVYYLQRKVKLTHAQHWGKPPMFTSRRNRVDTSTSSYDASSANVFPLARRDEASESILQNDAGVSTKASHRNVDGPDTPMFLNSAGVDRTDDSPSKSTPDADSGNSGGSDGGDGGGD